MQSTTSSSGNYTLDAFSDIGTDPSLAQVDVQNLVQWASPELPSLVTEQGVIVKKTTSSFINAINRDIKQLKNPCYFKHQKGQKAPCSLAS
jgi:multidrug efflux pump